MKTELDEYVGATAISPLEEAMNDLQERRDRTIPATVPTHLPPIALELAPMVFALRGEQLSPHHLAHLQRLLHSLTDLDPVLVMQCGERFVLVDGHLRREAYLYEGRTSIPVEVFHGSVREAHLEALRRNAKVTLQMDTGQRMDCAWRLVGARFTRAEIMQASGASRAQVGIMRKVLRALGDDGVLVASWWKAQRLAKGMVMSEATEEELAAKLEAQQQAYADRMLKHFGTKLATNPELAAGAMARHFGRKLGDLVRFLREYLSEDELDALGDEHAEF